jgi:hypothetical protein
MGSVDIAMAAQLLRSAKIFGGDGHLLAGTQNARLGDNPRRRRVEAETMAVRANRRTGTHNRIASLTNFESVGIGGDTGSRFGTAKCGWCGHCRHGKSDTGVAGPLVFRKNFRRIPGDRGAGQAIAVMALAVLRLMLAALFG